MQKIKIIQEQEHIQNNDNKFNNRMDLGLTDKVCMVTAASKGLGRASAYLYLTRCVDNLHFTNSRIDIISLILLDATFPVQILRPLFSHHLLKVLVLVLMIYSYYPLVDFYIQ